MKISQFCNRYLGKSDYHLRAVISECKELVTADSYKNFVEELNDVFFTSQMWLHRKTGLDWPMVWHGPSVKKMEDRLVVWSEIFTSVGLEFKPDYWTGGSNYKKPEKILAAIKTCLSDF